MFREHHSTGHVPESSTNLFFLHLPLKLHGLLECRQPLLREIRIAGIH